MFIIQNKIDCEISFLQHQSLQVRKFFQSAGKCTDASGQIQWRKVKGCLQETLTTVECNRQMTAIRGKFHPLSVWEKKGYDVAEIEKKGEKTESDMPPVSSWYSPVFANLFTSI